LSVDPHPSHHLVFDLHQIAGIEELRGHEFLVTHRLRARIQRPRLGQRLLLRMRLPLPSHNALLIYDLIYDVREIMPPLDDDRTSDTPYCITKSQRYNPTTAVIKERQ